jgi:hypothetical protein
MWISGDDWQSLLEHVVATSTPQCVFQMIDLLHRLHKSPYLPRGEAHALYVGRDGSVLKASNKQVLAQGPLVAFATTLSSVLISLASEDNALVSRSWLHHMFGILTQLRSRSTSYVRPSLLIDMHNVYTDIQSVSDAEQYKLKMMERIGQRSWRST